MTHPLTEKHPLHIPNEVLLQWYKEWEGGAPLDRKEWPAGHSNTYIGAKAAQWAADRQLEKVIEWLEDYTKTVEFLKHPHYVVTELEKAMRPQEDTP